MAKKGVHKGLDFLVFLVMSCYFIVCFCHASDTLRPGDILRNNENLMSADGVFELGFFSSGGSASNHYLGIWFKNDKYKNAVWVVNHDNPILDDLGILTIRYNGNMVIADIRLIPIIVNDGLLATSGNNPTTKLLELRNLVLVEEDEIIVWQSSACLTDTFLPGIKWEVLDLDTDQIRNQFLVSWLSPLVSNSGHFALGASSNRRLTPTPPICGDDTFSEIRGMILSSTVISGSVRMGPSDCEIMCRINCSCNAYASLCEMEQDVNYIMEIRTISAKS
ncbi:hypothetical protein Acr_13g0011850 [Actinidia rufa]|uniref:Bulb-type lectin domain-containing protein n=1 Tax=Actinidia rufa TaxID=165716 RepID=A0A7J0FM49_9ERIC|nr:hypothetical protein Acr_13g0011850 [Actinidia rufa]